ncbi:MAG TPA: hypothetical protein VK390_09885 [Propionibacteriaceae bacterium]|nr:hypothetical protein [Propionibacteriaceae bacterium]
MAVSPPRRYPDIGRRPDRRYLYLSTGIRGEKVTDVSQRLLVQYGGLRGLWRLDVAELALGTAASVSGERNKIPVRPSQAHDRGGIADRTPR